MNTRARLALIVALLLLAGLALVAMSGAVQGAAPTQGGAPTVVSYQGEVRVDGAPYNGAAYFKFAVVNQAVDTTCWSNDGTLAGPPASAVPLDVSHGLFSVLLGDTTLGGMTQPLTADVFSEPDRYLRVWFSTSPAGPFDLLGDDTHVAAVPYALQAQQAADADTVDGLHAADLGAHYQNVVVVAKSGGDFTAVQAAIDSIVDATAANPYLVWVAPGAYDGQVILKPHVHLQGAGQEATVLSSKATTGDWPPDQATLRLASDTSLRDLTVDNSGNGPYNVALLATGGTTRTLVAGVTARAQGNGTSNNYALYLRGSGTGVTLLHVTALAENATTGNCALFNYDGAAATLHGGSFTGRGGVGASGIDNDGSDGVGATLVAEGVTALGEGGSNSNIGLINYEGAATLYGGAFTGRGGSAVGISNSRTGATLEAEGVIALAENGSERSYGLENQDAAVTLRGGSFTGRGGTLYSRGIYNWGLGSDATLVAQSVTALGEDSDGENAGLDNDFDAAATLRGGSFTGRGGTDARGINNAGLLEAESVTALAENGTDSYGLENWGMQVTLHGGSFTGRGGSSAHGIYNDGTLLAEGVTALGQDGSGYNYGLRNEAGATATLRGGSFTARGGTRAYGLRNYGADATLKAENIAALGQDANDYNYGLCNVTGASTKVRFASVTGRGGMYARGLYNSGSGATLVADSVTAVGQDGTTDSYGLLNYIGTADATQGVLEGATYSAREVSGAVTVSNSRLVDGAASAGVTCVGVSRDGTFNAAGCP